MTNYESFVRSHRLLVLGIPLLVIAVASGLAALTSNDALETALGALVGGLTVVVLAIALAMVWRARNPVVSRPVTSEPPHAGRMDADRTDADRAALDALEPLRAARDDR